MTLKKKALENTVGKRENAGNQHFLRFPQCFQNSIILQVVVKSQDCVVKPSFATIWLI